MGWSQWTRHAAKRKTMRQLHDHHLQMLVRSALERWERSTVRRVWKEWRLGVARAAPKKLTVDDVKMDLHALVEKVMSASAYANVKRVELNGALRVICRCRPMLSRDDGGIGFEPEPPPQCLLGVVLVVRLLAQLDA